MRIEPSGCDRDLHSGQNYKSITMEKITAERKETGNGD